MNSRFLLAIFSILALSFLFQNCDGANRLTLENQFEAGLSSGGLPSNNGVTPVSFGQNGQGQNENQNGNAQGNGCQDGKPGASMTLTNTGDGVLNRWGCKDVVPPIFVPANEITVDPANPALAHYQGVPVVVTNP